MLKKLLTETGQNTNNVRRPKSNSLFDSLIMVQSNAHSRKVSIMGLFFCFFHLLNFAPIMLSGSLPGFVKIKWRLRHHVIDVYVR